MTNLTSNKKFTNKINDIKIDFNDPIKFVKGNVKTGKMLTLNFLMGDYEYDFNNCTLKGSCDPDLCKHCKNDCYNIKSYLQYTNNVVKSHGTNTYHLYNDNYNDLFNELDKQIKQAKTYNYIRFHACGELVSIKQLKLYCDLLKNNPSKHGYIYTKNYQVVKEYLNKYKLPDNMTILYSIWGYQGIKEFNEFKHLDNIKAFCVISEKYDKKFYYENIDFSLSSDCKAYDKNGKMNHNITCDKCKKCINSGIKVIWCHMH